MRNALSDNVVYADYYSIVVGSLASGDLPDLQSSNDVYMVFNDAQVGPNRVCEVEFWFTHSGHLPFIQVRAELHASASVLCEISAYNYNTGAWETAGTMYVSFALSTSDLTKYVYSLLNNINYRSAGICKVKIKCTRAGSTTPFTMSVDYLYFRTVAFQLGTSQTGTAAGNDLDVAGLTVGVRVWKVNADDSETEITLGVPVATVTGPSSTTILSSTWGLSPQEDNVVAVVVRIYRAGIIMQTGDLATGGLPLVFMTEDLNSFLNVATWTVYYAFFYSVFLDETFYRFGTTTYNSRITNFTWGVTVVAVPKGDGLTWVLA